MSGIVTELKKEHEQIIESFKLILTRNYDPVTYRQMINDIKTLLIMHLKKEDQEIYRKLELVGETNLDVLDTLNTFTTDIKFLTERFLTFVTNLEDDFDPKKCSEQFIEIASLIDRRIDREELILFDLYEKYCLSN